MGKMKVHELAKELGMQSKELVDKLIALKYAYKCRFCFFLTLQSQKHRYNGQISGFRCSHFAERVE